MYTELEVARMSTDGNLPDLKFPQTGGQGSSIHLSANTLKQHGRNGKYLLASCILFDCFLPNQVVSRATVLHWILTNETNDFELLPLGDVDSFSSIYCHRNYSQYWRPEEYDPRVAHGLIKRGSRIDPWGTPHSIRVVNWTPWPDCQTNERKISTSRKKISTRIHKRLGNDVPRYK